MGLLCFLLLLVANGLLLINDDAGLIDAAVWFLLLYLSVLA